MPKPSSPVFNRATKPRFFSIAASTLLAVALGVVPQAGTAQALPSLPPLVHSGADVGAQTAPLQPVQLPRSKRSGEEHLRRLFKRHWGRIFITPEAKAATGDPNIAVYDTRGGPDSGPFQCTYFFVRGKRALLCD